MISASLIPALTSESLERAFPVIKRQSKDCESLMALGSGSIIATPLFSPRSAATLRKTRLGDKGVASLRGEKLQARYRSRYGAELPLAERGFNAGVFIFNLAAWLALNLTAEQKPGVSFDSRGACLDRAEVPKQCALLMLGPHSPLESALLTRC